MPSISGLSGGDAAAPLGSLATALLAASGGGEFPRAVEPADSPLDRERAAGTAAPEEDRR